jgi:hypothetical protein
MSLSFSKGDVLDYSYYTPEFELVLNKWSVMVQLFFYKSESAPLLTTYYLKQTFFCNSLNKTLSGNQFRASNPSHYRVV